MQVWHSVMVAVSTVNLLAALFLFFRSFQWKKREPQNTRYFLLLRTMGLIFVSIALYRSIFVSSYPDRLVWFDSLLNSPFLIRCIAVFAEMSSIGLVAVIQLKLSKDMALSGGVGKFPYVSVVCIFFAQFFAFAGLITQFLWPFAIEETLWALAYFCVIPVAAAGLKGLKKQEQKEKHLKFALVIMLLWCAGYLAFQCFYALPFMYYGELAQDAGKLIPENALNLAIYNFMKTRDFNTWGGIGFFIWHSGYFSLCSWLALIYMSAPRKQHMD